MASIDGITQYNSAGIYSGKQRTEAAVEGKAAGSTRLNELTAGKIFEGSITEMKNGQVTIGLSNGQSITARMEGSVHLKQGEPMLFEVRSNNGSQIDIRPVSVESALNPTLNQALKAAGITVNARNIAMVNAMMKEQLPIDKASLQNMLKVSMQFSSRDVATIVQMSKLNFNMSEASITQFENYKTNQHMLQNQMQDFIAELPNAMKGSHASPQELLNFHQQLLQIFGEGGQSAASGQNIMPGSMQQAKNEMQNINLPGILEGAAGETAGTQAEAGAAGQPLGIAGEAIGQPIGEGAGQLPGMIGSAAGQSPGMIGEGAGQPPGMLGEGAGQPPGVIGEAVNQLPGAAGEAASLQTGGSNAEVSSVLSGQEVKELTDQLKDFPKAMQDSSLWKEGQLNTELSPQQLLEKINQILNSSGGTAAAFEKLLHGKSYQKLMKHVIEKQWTLSPQEVQGEPGVEKFYEKLNHQLSELDQLLNSSGKENTALSKSVDQMRNNLDFMNQVNQMYNYIQLPLKMNNQNAHSDLYVYTNKKNLRDKEGELTALLHLDMEHLGATDIYIKLKDDQVDTTFYLADDRSCQLIVGNAQILEKKLEEKGYFCRINVENKKKEQDFVEDFLKQEQPIGKLHRYSFDMKA